MGRTRRFITPPRPPEGRQEISPGQSAAPPRVRRSIQPHSPERASDRSAPTSQSTSAPRPRSTPSRRSLMPFQGDGSTGRPRTQGDAIDGCRRRFACPGLTSDAASRREHNPNAKRGPSTKRDPVARSTPAPDRATAVEWAALADSSHRPVRPKGVKRSARGRAQRRPGYEDRFTPIALKGRQTYFHRSGPGTNASSGANESPSA